LPCIIEMLSVGNELLLGNTINTNASWMAAQATSVGAEVSRITTVGDNLRDISNAVRESLRRRPNFLIITGGIGPTFDDMTLKGVAKALNKHVQLNRRAVELIRGHYERRFKGKPMKLTGPRLKMARIPEGGVPVHNPVGTAPAVLLSADRTQVFCLPGVPSEAKAIFHESLLGKIRSRAGGRYFVERWSTIKGIMESNLAPIIDRIMTRTPGVYIKSHPRGVENGVSKIELHFSTFSSSEATAHRTVRGAISAMKKELRRQPGKVRMTE